MGTKLKAILPDKKLVKKILSKETAKANERLVRLDNIENMKKKGYTVVAPHKEKHQYTSDLVLMKK